LPQETGRTSVHHSRDKKRQRGIPLLMGKRKNTRKLSECEGGDKNLGNLLRSKTTNLFGTTQMVAPGHSGWGKREDKRKIQGESLKKKKKNKVINGQRGVRSGGVNNSANAHAGGTVHGLLRYKDCGARKPALKKEKIFSGEGGGLGTTIRVGTVGKG